MKSSTDNSTNSIFNKKLRGIVFPFLVARRYLFSKKSHNAINIVSAISATGVCIGTIALVCVLSVLNGFESLISNLFSTFDPDLKITLVQGKNFESNDEKFDEVRRMPSVIHFTEVLEQNALLRFRDKQMPATIKGVSDDFRQMTRIDSIMFDGKFQLFDGAFERSVPGFGVAAMLGLTPHFIDPLYIYAPKRTAKINTLRPENSFNECVTFVSGIFSVQQPPYDEQYVLVSLELARELFDHDSCTVSAIELKLADNVKLSSIQKQIQTVLGSDFQVKNRYEQQESFYNILKIEKWITFLILCFILLIACFNIIGSLSMLIIEKKNDIATLRDLGADNRLIKRIFLFEGWMISLVGALAGIILGIIICLVQQHFGLLKLGTGYVTEAYPMLVRFSDVLIVLLTVLSLGFFAAYYPVRHISKKLK